MRVEFHQDPSLKDNEVKIEVKAKEESNLVRKIIRQLNQFGERSRTLLPVKTADRIVTIKYDDLVKVEVQSTTLTFYTVNEIIKTTGRLYQVLESLNNDFIQVSRHSVINLNYLQSIESGFAGNMVAILSANLKVDVSRRYLPQLEKELGL